MILVDTSVWVDHLARSDQRLQIALEADDVLMHPLVLGEIACGNLRDRRTVLGLLSELPQIPGATHREALTFIEAHGLAGRGIGFVDVHLLAAVALTPGAALWTRDRRLHMVAVDMGLAGAAN